MPLLSAFRTRQAGSFPAITGIPVPISQCREQQPIEDPKRRPDRYIWTSAQPGAKHPKNTGSAINGAKGDIRHRNGYVIVWNRKSANHALAIAKMTQTGNY